MKINQITQSNPQIQEASLSNAIKGNVQKLKSTFGAGKKSTPTPSAGANAFGQMAQQLTPADPVDSQTQKFIQQLVAGFAALTPAERLTLKKELEDAVTASDVGTNVVKGTMESRRNKKRTV
jgi:hypothetical protein